jgi:hypothetical protein
LSAQRIALNLLSNAVKFSNFAGKYFSSFLTARTIVTLGKMVASRTGRGLNFALRQSQIG